MARIAAERRTLRYAEAREHVLAAARPLPTETVSLTDALGRPLAEPVVAAIALPPFRNSAMDGVAVRSTDLASASAANPVVLAVVETIPAGRIASRALVAGEAMRIMTGAMVPDGADAIVPVEELESEAGATRVRITRPSATGNHVREAGRDVARGEVAVPAGRAVTPHDLGLLGALGVTRVTVGGRPRVAVLSTGDELLDIDAVLLPGAIRDSNLPMLAALVEAAGGVVVTARRIGDDPREVTTALEAALDAADVVLTIGGVSMGDFDPVKQAIAGVESVELWRVAMRPGQPQAFGAPDGTLFFGLPGNPASVACVFEALVRPALRRMQGFTHLDRPRLTVRAATTVESKPGRTDFVRVTLASREDGWWATPAGEQISGHLAPQSRAHALLVVPEAAARIERGETADALVLRWPGEDAP